MPGQQMNQGLYQQLHRQPLDVPYYGVGVLPSEQGGTRQLQQDYLHQKLFDQAIKNKNAPGRFEAMDRYTGLLQDKLLRRAEELEANSGLYRSAFGPRPGLSFIPRQPTIDQATYDWLVNDHQKNSPPLSPYGMQQYQSSQAWGK